MSFDDTSINLKKQPRARKKATKNKIQWGPVLSFQLKGEARKILSVRMWRISLLALSFSVFRLAIDCICHLVLYVLLFCWLPGRWIRIAAHSWIFFSWFKWYKGMETIERKHCPLLNDRRKRLTSFSFLFSCFPIQFLQPFEDKTNFAQLVRVNETCYIMCALLYYLCADWESLYPITYCELNLY